MEVDSFWKAIRTLLEVTTSSSTTQRRMEGPSSAKVLYGLLITLFRQRTSFQAIVM